MSNTCCPTSTCCIGTVTKAPGDRLKVRIDMSDWVAAGGSILTTSFTATIIDMATNTTAPPPPAGVGIVAGSVSLENTDDLANAVLAFGVEGGTDGNTYRIDASISVRDCTGFEEVKEFCVLVQVAGVA